MANSVDPDQTAPIGAVCSVSILFASIVSLSVMLGNYLQQTTSADDIFRFFFFLALKGLTQRISYIIAHVLLNLFNELGKIDQMHACRAFNHFSSMSLINSIIQEQECYTLCIV